MTIVDDFDLAAQINELTDRLRFDKVDFNFFPSPTGLAFLMGAFVGGTVVYFLDPISGRRRRSLLRDKGVHFSKVVDHYRDRKARHLKNKVHGLAASMRS